MDASHARYPFLDAAREAVGAAGVDLLSLVQEDHPAVDRGRERVERALVAGTVETDRRVTPRVEVLSYPVARVLVSLLEVPGAVEKYAAAEAATAYERLSEEFSGTRPGGATLALPDLLGEFGLDDEVREAADGYRVRVGTYLRLAPGGEGWALVRRDLASGTVGVTRAELHELLRRAVEERVAAGLPLDVPDPIASALDSTARDVERALSSRNYPRSFDADPTSEAFPPCIEHLLAAARDDDDLPAHSTFALVSFLARVGMSDEEIRALTGRDGEAFGYALERLASEGGTYAPPSCATMQALGDCVNPDDLCATISHPLEYYAEEL
ncbi:DNA primase [Halomarina ordinaria]|uniref:DNA primase large subunit PriL n=1 Tax=Halomarina ordinaria TaxID=3033939 RepID=A0ABD5UCS0_9EURY|nr:DNA primase [Halomarina sp. PSRA2]